MKRYIIEGGKNKKILEEIIKPKDNVIQNLYQDNMNFPEICNWRI